MTELAVYDETPCALGEGPLWHPVRQQFFWFDIIKHRLYSREGDRLRTWAFEEHVSAAGWVDETRLMIASETRLFVFDVETGTREDVCALEDDMPATRSNDGRADPWGGFWIGTMGKAAEPGLGAIYRYYGGELRKLYPDITISNAICFAPEGNIAYWADTAKGIVMRQHCDPDTGWPVGAPEPWLDLSGEDFGVDGAVVSSDGTFWNAQWGGWRVAAYAPDGSFLRALTAPAAHTSCPAFGGPDLDTLYCTSARQGLSDADKARSPHHGMTFAAHGVARGQAEHRVLLA
ncbi:SMP-30/gluconolactonase/LRE family protein [Alphaproteobacteria bacterium GH1-50]|uniref:SMP-30/gluconolactonase/LRE family protein n=1 Tax=Kangsaoukella pontilimi TaxID=2691042 RepID=A0A7C9MC49_9RHOB|nr:SMP-30/gluconolactonase/LRE family protein [Kangsaoukella pontilimi]MXQ09153.1 SMP-30/gluconolactonase/LRE family protein [Kangsaoukella pontilimi]